MKLWVHQKSFCEEELIFNLKEFPGIQVGDVLEIYHPDENNSRLLLQVKTLKNVELPQKDIISVEQTIANLFQLRAYKDVTVSPVSSVQDVGLDLVELVFKDQYISRSDMWRLKNSLVRSCIHLQQKIEFTGIRAQVNELWARGEKVMCGVVTEDTRVAFRSCTAMVYMFVQMSSEMWDFDTCGDLYLEKAVNGFLTELFCQWKRSNINSELTLVLFSRTIYEAKSINEFPKSMHGALHVGSTGRIYEDFYRVVVHNERRDDWVQMLSTLKQVMWEYHEAVASSHQEEGSIPKSYNSKAADGNLLEAMNMSLNVFDNHYINRNFDRTGQVVEIITPGAGVFHVDRTLCDITKYRMIDYGIGSDLVCLAEQSPHPVPLLLFNDDIAKTPGSTDTHHIPYWLNYSFYLSPSQRHRNFSSSQSHFIPRIRLPTRNAPDNTSAALNTLPKLPPRTANETYSSVSHDASRHDEGQDEFSQYDRAIFKSHPARVKKCNNPFVPSSLTTKLTPDRRRWTHTFPHGPHGDVIQLHHKSSSQSLMESSGGSGSELSSSSSASSLCNESAVEETTADESPSRIRSLMVNLKRRIGCGWGITGEQVWTPFLQTGVDWKSLTATACFPITTDFYPDKKTLETDYLESPHTLDIIPDNGEEACSPSGKTIQCAFEELVSQRLIQNYQLIVLPRSEIASLAHKGSSHLPLVTNPSKHEYILSYGQAYHKILLKPDMKSVEIVRYNAREPRTSPKLSYSYRLWAIRHSGYETAHTRVYHKPVDNKWNHRDNYICLRGEATKEGFDLQESLKFWRSRFILLPSASFLIRKLSDQGYQGPLDVFEERSTSQRLTLLDGFLRFVEGWNRKRRAPSKAASQRPSVVGDLPTQTVTTPRRLKSRSGVASGDSTPTASAFQPNPMLSTTSINSALASIGIVVGGGARGKEAWSGGGVYPPKGSPGSPEPYKLSLLMPASHVAAVMRSPSEGVSLLTGDVKGLPSDCFVSADAVAWIRKYLIGGVSHDEALSLMQTILEEGYIRSVFSAMANKTFLYGYYIYCFVPQSEVTSPDSRRLTGIPATRSPLTVTFDMTPRTPWFEVSCSHPEGGNDEKISHHPSAEEEKNSEGREETGAENNEEIDSPEVKKNGLLSQPETGVRQPAYKSLFLEIDSSKLKDRVEWCHVGYHSNYNPVSAFEIELQWLTSTPGLLQELITNWSRRAVTSGFHLVPTHLDPFGFNSDTADSLHSPLFIELRLPEGCLGDGVGSGEGSTALVEGRKIQRAILTRFGFLSNQTSYQSPLASNTQSDHSTLPIHSQYVHVTGCAYLLALPLAPRHLPPSAPQRLPCLCKLGAGHADAQGGTRFKSPCQKLGFLYVHNYLLSKKWRSSATGDERFHEGLLADLSRFCRGEDGRLERLWQTMRSCKGEKPLDYDDNDDKLC